MSSAENAGFKHEYHEIPRGELFPCEEAKKPENKLKNRYTTTFPYDHSRVVLKTSSTNESDYINANYIEDTQSILKYIATQGPKPKTVVDFWRMVWQKCVTTIVCLTNLKEGTKIKCTQYWPNFNDKMQHGTFMIRNLEERVYANYTSRRFKVYNNMERKDREVVMFHYTRWPDHGVPDPLNLVVFHRHVTKNTSKSGKYTLVHCSAGIGRTGTYIALDALYREGERNGQVNVPMYVRTMRKDRMNMIQGDDQYRVVYLALCESFSGRSKCLTAEKLSQQSQDRSCYTNCGEVTHATSLSSEFQELQSLRIKYAEKDYESGHTNISANYTESVLPVEKFMCYLSYTKGRNNYYNAVLLQSFTENDCLISAQYPLPEYTEDLLRLIRDFDARVVVFLGLLKEIKSSSLWVPSKSENKTVGSFVLNLTTSTNSINFTTRNIVLQPKGGSDMTLTVMECKTWKEGRFLTDKRVLLDVVKEAKSEKDKQEGKILVLSSDGATRCGAFAVVYNALEQLAMDKEVDIFTITRQLQIRRPEFVSTLEEYQLCYDVVAEYMQNDSVYANC
ncbi:receptor-type tyrosine-protein phosphatase alpha-like [Saccostrea echinata]|uniref:receptor-type tyrosine-protein phosphatase alpha-like n=1 Tax=Saccostrea echinata TaxID=191078 RepID=UPI002A81C42F|nr:receptor-type tyrosine-protein phosphatase alpha-like [Saccostrea echinata]